MKYIFILLILLGCASQPTAIKVSVAGDSSLHEKGITFVRAGEGDDLIDSATEKVLCDTFIDWHDGTEPGLYHKVQYDYGVPPPDGSELAYAFLSGITGDSSNIRGWKVKWKKVLEMDGDYTYVSYNIVCSFENPVFYLEKYRFSLDAQHGDGFKIEVKQVDDTSSRHGIFFGGYQQADTLQIIKSK